MPTYRAFRPPGGDPPIAGQSCCEKQHQTIRAAVRCRWRCGREDLPIVSVDEAGAPRRLTADEEQNVLHELDMMADDYAEAIGS